MNTNQIGKITELEVISYVIRCGYSVSLPFGDKDRYDQIWDINGKLFKVQVKTSKWTDEKHTAITFNCYTVCNGKKHLYADGEVDLFATMCDGQLYVVPKCECSTQKKLRFFSGEAKLHNVNWASNYTFEEVLKRL